MPLMETMGHTAPAHGTQIVAGHPHQHMLHTRVSPGPLDHEMRGSASPARAGPSTYAAARSPSHAQQQQQHPSASRQPNGQQAGSASASSAAAASSNLSVPVGAGAMPTTAATLMREGPRDFTVIKDVGDGSFGTVCLADWRSPLPSGTMLSPMQHPTTRPEYVGKRLVAIKKMKKPFPNWEECMKLKELKSLIDISAHPNIIPLYDAFLMPVTKELHFVFECMEGNLYQLTKSRKGRPLAGGLVASIFQQIVRGLHHIHEHGYFHRDMKPENLLITTTGLADYPPSAPFAAPGTPPERDVLVIVKLADFGLARETASKPPYTEYVSTRWYRAPEVLLRSRDYSNPVDMWALGTILAELVNLKPLFPGQSEVDQVLQITEVLGDPSAEYGHDERGRVRGGGDWPGGIKMARAVGFTFPKAKPFVFSSLFSSRVPSPLVDCIQDLIRYDPRARLTTQDCLQHPYFCEVAPRLLPPQAKAPAPEATPSKQVPRAQLQPLPADRMAVDPSAPRRSVPPSHSAVTASAKVPFGLNAPLGVDGRPLPQVRVAQGQQSPPNGQSAPHRVPFQPQRQAGQVRGDVAMQIGSPMHVDAQGPSNEVPSWVAGREPSVSQYAAFPESASTFAGSSHTSMHFDDVAMRNAPQQHQQQQQQQQQRYGQHLPTSNSQQTVYDDELSLALSREQAGQRSVPHDNEANTSADTFATADRRRSKGWGKGMFAGRSAAASTEQFGLQQSSSRPIAGAEEPARTSPPAGPTPAQKLAAEHAVPKDPKRAKKEAEKAAREAEKAKRAAQEKAARDRARAVMQKRNQILASSNTREQVEWLNGAVQESDMSRAPSEKSRGKQPAGILPSSAASFGRSDYNSGVPSPHGNSFTGVYSPQAGTPSSSWQARGKARKREGDDDVHSMSSLDQEQPNPRRMSIQSFATGDSDPGPGRSHMHAHPAYLQRQSSANSLNSAPGLLDQSGRRLRGYPDAHRQQPDNRSLSSLEHQLENLTAAEMRQRTPGSASPGPTHLVGSRPSLSRQSHGSRTGSAHRQGSASPLHHTAAPRFHPYGGPTMSSGHSSAHSAYSFNLPPLPSIAGSGVGTPGTSDYTAVAPSPHTPGSGRPRSVTRRASNTMTRGISRGSVSSNPTANDVQFATYATPAPHPLTLHSAPGVINPMFQVPKQPIHGAGAGAGFVLPPFSELAAAADDGSPHHYNHNNHYGQPHQ